MGIRGTPPSRRNKKQVVAHLDPVLVEAVHLRRRERGLTVQEIVAEAVNAAAAAHGRHPILTVRRERLVRRENALARERNPAAVPRSRAGKRRVAAWFERGDVERLKEFASQVGMGVDALVERGLRSGMTAAEIGAAADSLERAKAAVPEEGEAVA